MHTIMVPVQVKTLKIQVGVQVLRPGELRRHLQLWNLEDFICVVFVLDRNIIKEAVIDEEMTEIQANCILNQPFALAQEKYSGFALDQCHQCKTLCTLKDVKLLYATRLCIPDAIVAAHQIVADQKELENQHRLDGTDLDIWEYNTHSIGGRCVSNGSADVWDESLEATF
ncbi:hypothetical protein Tco_0500458 [Tanacetum coccineum]